MLFTDERLGSAYSLGDGVDISSGDSSPELRYLDEVWFGMRVGFVWLW